MEPAMNIEGAIARGHQDFLGFNDVGKFDPADDQPLFAEIRSVLAKHGALHRFGVKLLHKHFNVYEGERMVEVSDPDERAFSIRPVRDALAAGESYVETNWRFDVSSAFVNQRCFADCLKSGGGKHHVIHKKK